MPTSSLDSAEPVNKNETVGLWVYCSDDASSLAWRARGFWRKASRSCLLLRVRLLQPEPHGHLAVHRCRDREVLLGLLTVARAPVEPAAAEVAAGDERAHAEVRGETHRPVITRHHASSSSRALASLRSAVSRPLVKPA